MKKHGYIFGDYKMGCTINLNRRARHEVYGKKFAHNKVKRLDNKVYRKYWNQLQEAGLKTRILKKILVLEIPKFVIEKFKADYNQKRRTYSFEDYCLARTASYTGFSVVSYDKHLTRDLPETIKYEYNTPETVFEIEKEQHQLLDTNIIIHMLEQGNSWKSQCALAMIENANLDGILLTPSILKECTEILKKLHLNKSQRRNRHQSELAHRGKLYSKRFQYIYDYLRDVRQLQHS